MGFIFSKVPVFTLLLCVGVLFMSCGDLGPLTPPPSSGDEETGLTDGTNADADTATGDTVRAQENDTAKSTDAAANNAPDTGYSADLAASDTDYSTDQAWDAGTDSGAGALIVDTETSTGIFAEEVYGPDGTEEPGCYCPGIRHTDNGDTEADTDSEMFPCDCASPLAIEPDTGAIMCLRPDIDSDNALDLLSDTEAMYYECPPDATPEDSVLWLSLTSLVLTGEAQNSCARLGESPDVQVDSLEFMDLPVEEALSRATIAMTGSWIGSADAPDAWMPAAWDIALTFKEDGSYQAETNRMDAPPFYYGSVDQCNDLRSWELNAVTTSGVSGILEVPFEYGWNGNAIECDLPAWQGEILNIAMDAGRTRLTFEFMTDTGYGPVRYDLRKVCSEMDTDTQ